MIYLLNAGFGEPLPPDDLGLIQFLGYQGVRQDVPTVAVAPALVDNILDAGLMGIFIVPVAEEQVCYDIAHAVALRAAERQQGERVVIEVGNEEDLRGKRWARDPAGWAALVANVLAARVEGAWGRVVSGGVSSLSRQAMGWLERSRVRDLRVGVGYHQYRSTPPAKPLDGYASREDEFRALRDAAGLCKAWMTESGWNTAKRTSGCWPFRKTWSYTDEQVAQFLRVEMDMNAEHDAQCFVTYQLNDGPNPKNGQDCFGVRRTDGTLKPSAEVLL
jgi:hypothetical protein